MLKEFLNRFNRGEGGDKLLYPTLNQPLVLLAIFIGGLIAGFGFDVFRLLTLLSGGDKLSRHFFDFLATIFAFFLLFYINLNLNYGQFRIYVPVVFLISFALQRLFARFLWTKLLSKWYSKITERTKKGGRKKEEKD